MLSRLLQIRLKLNELVALLGMDKPVVLIRSSDGLIQLRSQRPYGGLVLVTAEDFRGDNPLSRDPDALDALARYLDVIGTFPNNEVPLPPPNHPAYGG